MSLLILARSDAPLPPELLAGDVTVIRIDGDVPTHSGEPVPWSAILDLIFTHDRVLAW